MRRDLAGARRQLRPRCSCRLKGAVPPLGTDCGNARRATPRARPSASVESASGGHPAALRPGVAAVLSRHAEAPRFPLATGATTAQAGRPSGRLMLVRSAYWARRVRVRAEHATVAGERFQHRPACLAAIEVLAGVGRHRRARPTHRSQRNDRPAIATRVLRLPLWVMHLPAVVRGDLAVATSLGRCSFRGSNRRRHLRRVPSGVASVRGDERRLRRVSTVAYSS